MTTVLREGAEAPVTGERGSSRLVLLDAIRAVAIISMVIGHVANYSFLWRTSHFAYYVWDGAQLFMLVSGIVVGVVHHRIVARHGVRASVVKLAKRAGLLYVVQVLLVLIGLVVATILPGPLTAEFWPEGINGWPQAIGWSLVLGVNPIYINFLSTYVVVLLAAIPVVWLLRHRQVAIVLAIAAVVYVLGLLAPQALAFRNGPLGAAEMNNATWFALFLTGLVVGWHWHRWNVGDRLRSAALSMTAAIAWVALLGIVVVDALRPALVDDVDWWFDKGLMSPGRLVASWVFFVMLYWVASDLARRPWGWRVLDPMAVLGGRALDAVVILTVASIVLPGLTHQPSESRLAQVFALAVLGACWAWAYARHAWRHRADAPGPHAFTPR